LTQTPIWFPLKVHVTSSRKGTGKKILGLVTDEPELSAADLIRTSEKTREKSVNLSCYKGWDAAGMAKEGMHLNGP
jgi:hypothetical protein